MSEFKVYRRIQLAELRPYKENEILSDKVSISKADLENGSPKLGDMIARNPKNHDDQWLVAKDYFYENFIPTGENICHNKAFMKMSKEKLVEMLIQSNEYLQQYEDDTVFEIDEVEQNTKVLLEGKTRVRVLQKHNNLVKTFIEPMFVDL
jgi:hypothetical protein